MKASLRAKRGRERRRTMRTAAAAREETTRGGGSIGINERRRRRRSEGAIPGVMCGKMGQFRIKRSRFSFLSDQCSSSYTYPSQPPPTSSPIVPLFPCFYTFPTTHTIRPCPLAPPSPSPTPLRQRQRAGGPTPTPATPPHRSPTAGAPAAASAPWRQLSPLLLVLPPPLPPPVWPARLAARAAGRCCPVLLCRWC